jgi:subtilase family serine protease
MRTASRSIRLTVAAAVALLGAGAISASPATAAGGNREADVNSCARPTQPGFAYCHAHVRIDAVARNARPAHAGAPVSPNAIGNNGGYDPAFLRSAYNLDSSGGSGLTVAIVDAFDDPNAEANLATYRSHFGLSACTTAGGCFRKVDQRGGTAYPAANKGWAEEISLDVDMVSAICPNCTILLVEADTNSLANLGAAVNRAVAMGAMAVSNSYGGGEYSGETSDSGTYYNHPGVAVTVSSGDSGYGVEFPAASRYVTAVGGTTLNQATNTGTRNATETAWSGAGSGCSAYEAKPAWQADSGCSRRTVADVSAVADPSTGVWVYDTYGGDPGWLVFGGTSVASPIIAAIDALGGQPGATDTPASYPYAHTASLFDITSGSNGSCGGSYLCTAASGYDGPTGLGTPNTAAAFSGTPPPPPLGALSLSAAQTLSAGQPSAAMTASIAPAPASSVPVTLTSSSGKGSFATSTSGPWSSALTVSVDSSGSSSAFYYQDTAAGSPTITAATTGYTPGKRTEQVNAGPLARITLSPSNATVGRGGSVRFTASGSDAYGNAVAVTTPPSWSVSPSLGSFGSISGASATFTAGNSTGSGTITARVGAFAANASITVRRR